MKIVYKTQNYRLTENKKKKNHRVSFECLVYVENRHVLTLKGCQVYNGYVNPPASGTTGHYFPLVDFSPEMHEEIYRQAWENPVVREAVEKKLIPELLLPHENPKYSHFYTPQVLVE